MRGGRGSAVTTALIVVLVLAVGGMAAYIFMSRNAVQQAEERERRSYVVTEENAGEMVEQIERKKTRHVGSYTAQMNSEWHFPDGKSPSTDAYVANSKDNKWDVWFDVTLSDGRTVYESPILPVDTYIQNFALTTNLEAGSYNAALTYHVVDEDQEELTTVSVGVSLIVEG